jgi:hypothetical protein
VETGLTTPSANALWTIHKAEWDLRAAEGMCAILPKSISCCADGKATNTANAQVAGGAKMVPVQGFASNTGFTKSEQGPSQNQVHIMLPHDLVSYILDGVP